MKVGVLKETLPGERRVALVPEVVGKLKAAGVDTVILGCTHYSILKDQIRAILGHGHDLICSGQVTAARLVDYLKRHPEMEARLSRGGTRRYLTTDLTPRFKQLASLFMGHPLSSEVVEL